MLALPVVDHGTIHTARGLSQKLMGIGVHGVGTQAPSSSATSHPILETAGQPLMTQMHLCRLVQ